MSGPHFAQPGKVNAAQADNVMDPMGHANQPPGKSTQVEAAYKTGDAAIDTGNMGSRRGAFLSHDQRQALVAEYHGRVESAHLAYVTALTMIQLDTLIEKEEEVGIFQAILEAAGAKLMETGLGMIVAGLKTGHDVVKKLAEVGIEGVKEAEAEPKIMGLSAKTVEGLIAMATDKAKEKAHPHVTAKLGGEKKDHAKKQKLSYAKLLGDASMMMFQKIREKPPGTATDAEMIALVESFSGDRHTITLYQEALESQIGRYMHSHVKDIGRTEGKSPAAGRNAEASFRLENRVAWLQTGGGRQLIYVDRAFETRDDILPNENPDGKYLETGKAYNESPMLSLEDEGTWYEGTNNPDKSSKEATHQAPYDPDMQGKGKDGSKRRHENAVGYEKMLGVVEPEFQDLALQMQEEKWQAEPETFRYDYRTAPPTLIKVGK